MSDTEAWKEAIQKQAPAAGLPILKIHDSNFVHWKEALHNNLLTKYGSLGQFIQTEALYQRPIPDPAVICASLNLSHFARIKNDADYATALTTYNVVTLFGIIRKVHTLNIHISSTDSEIFVHASKNGRYEPFDPSGLILVHISQTMYYLASLSFLSTKQHPFHI